MAEKKIAAPIIPDAFIAQQKAKGEELRDKQSRPRFAGTEPPFSSGQNVLLHALLGLQAGTKAGIQTSPLQSPLVSLLAGLGAGAKVPGAVEEMGIEKLGNRPVDEISPALVQEFPELQGVPLSLVHKISPLLSRQADIKSRFALLREKATQAHGRGELSPQARKLLSEISGVPEDELIGLSGIEAQRLGLTPRPLAGDQLKLLENVRQGMGNISDALPIIDSSDALTFKLAAIQGVKGDAVRIGNTNAQAINRLLSSASDILTRLRTGAALNQNEEKYYGNLLNNILRDPAQNRQSISELYEFFQRAEQEIQAGQRGPGSKLLKQSREAKKDSAPSASTQPVEKPIALSGDKAKRLAELRAKLGGGKP